MCRAARRADATQGECFCSLLGHKGKGESRRRQCWGAATHVGRHSVQSQLHGVRWRGGGGETAPGHWRYRRERLRRRPVQHHGASHPAVMEVEHQRQRPASAAGADWAVRCLVQGATSCHIATYTQRLPPLIHPYVPRHRASRLVVGAWRHHLSPVVLLYWPVNGLELGAQLLHLVARVADGLPLHPAVEGQVGGSGVTRKEHLTRLTGCACRV